MGSRTSETKDLIDSLVNAKTLAQGDFDLAMKQAEGLYEARGKDILEEQAIAEEQRKNAMNRENMVFQEELGLRSNQAQFEQGLAQQAQLASDPVSAISGIIKQFSDIGIV